MDYKLIALDIDGTLTNSRKEILPRTRYALLEAQAQGKKIILASGRHPPPDGTRVGRQKRWRQDAGSHAKTER